MLRIDFRDLDDITPVGYFGWLGFHHLVGKLVKSLELIAGEDEDLVRYLGVFDIVYAILPFGDKAEVMASTPDSPKEVWV